MLVRQRARVVLIGRGPCGRITGRERARWAHDAVGRDGQVRRKHTMEVVGEARGIVSERERKRRAMGDRGTRVHHASGRLPRYEGALDELNRSISNV